MLKLITAHSQSELEVYFEKGQIVDFLYLHLDRFRDDKSAISKAIDYAFSREAAKGGFVLLALMDGSLAGVMVMNNTGMEEFIPENILVYIAVHQDYRGQGIGAKMIKHAFEICEGSIALHVEYDNPAKRLYEKLGFVSKYAEMRYYRA